jgi:hypothetical protein
MTRARTVAIRFRLADLEFTDAAGSLRPSLPEDVLVYLTRARSDLDTNIALLLGLDAHRDDLFDGPLLRALADTTRKLRAELAQKPSRTFLRCPAYWDQLVANPEPMTRQRILATLDELSALAELGIEHGHAVIARGD